jgi:HSP20 family protein
MLFSSCILEHPQTFNLNIYAMTLLKFNRQNGLFPWRNDAFKSLLSFDPFVNDDFTFDNGIIPAMNIQEKDDLFEIEFAVPGFSKEDFNITLDENILHVSGEKNSRGRRNNGKLYAQRVFLQFF